MSPKDRTNLNYIASLYEKKKNVFMIMLTLEHIKAFSSWLSHSSLTIIQENTISINMDS